MCPSSTSTRLVLGWFGRTRNGEIAEGGECGVQHIREFDVNALLFERGGGRCAETEHPRQRIQHSYTIINAQSHRQFTH